MIPFHSFPPMKVLCHSMGRKPRRCRLFTTIRAQSPLWSTAVRTEYSILWDLPFAVATLRHGFRNILLHYLSHNRSHSNTHSQADACGSKSTRSAFIRGSFFKHIETTSNPISVITHNIKFCTLVKKSLI